MKTYYVVAIVFLALIAIPARTQSPQKEAGPQAGPQCGGMMGMKMPASKLAEIRVYPMAQYKQDQADITRLREIVKELRSNPSADAIGSKRHAQLEEELFKLLDNHLERYTTDNGKSETAVAIQTKLNQMEGKMMCGACHGHGMGMGMGGMRGMAGGGR